MDWNLQVVVAAKDPVCWMAVDMATELRSEYKGETYYFCSRGCLLDFGDDPEKYLDPEYQPSGMEMGGMADTHGDHHSH
jgi:YHS domain-containing protein